MKQIVDLIPERLRSRKLALTSALMYLITQMQTLGIEVPGEVQAYLMTALGGLYITVQGIEDIVKAWRNGGLKAAAALVAEEIKPASDVDTPEG